MSEAENQSASKKVPLSRRKFLDLLWIGGLLLTILNMFKSLGKAILPRRPQRTYSSKFKVGTLAKLHQVIEPPLAFPEGLF
jgi:hypothetical protein